MACGSVLLQYEETRFSVRFTSGMPKDEKDEDRSTKNDLHWYDLMKWESLCCESCFCQNYRVVTSTLCYFLKLNGN